MSRVDLEQLEDLHQSTTPGPWWDSPVKTAPGHHTIRGGPDDWRGFDGSLGGDRRPIARIAPALAEDGTPTTEHDADAAFMVEAHRLLPALISELRAAREARDDLVRLRDDLDASDLFAVAAYRLGNALRAWDEAT
jgi:hypothetical protein